MSYNTWHVGDGKMVTYNGETPNGYIVDTKADRAKFYASAEWRELRTKAMARDHYECVWCARDGKVSTNSVLEVDHIKELAEYPEYALDLDNLRTLCKECHNLRHERFNYRPKPKECRPYSSATYDEWW